MFFSFSIDSGEQDLESHYMGIVRRIFFLSGSMWTFSTVPIAPLEVIRATWHCLSSKILNQRQGAARCHPVEDDDVEMTGQLACRKSAAPENYWIQTVCMQGFAVERLELEGVDMSVTVESSNNIVELGCFASRC